MERETIGTRISELRKERGLTQNELAERLQVSNKAISKWESGGGDPSIEFLPLLASELNCSIDYLLTGKYFTLNKTNYTEKLMLTLGKDSDGNDIRKSAEDISSIFIESKDIDLNKNVIEKYYEQLKAQNKLCKIVYFSDADKLSDISLNENILIISEPEDYSLQFESLKSEMDRRYNQFSSLGANNIRDYNNSIKVREHVFDSIKPIYLVVDDLETIQDVDILNTIHTLQVLGRSVGIYCIISSSKEENFDDLKENSIVSISITDKTNDGVLANIAGLKEKYDHILI